MTITEFLEARIAEDQEAARRSAASTTPDELVRALDECKAKHYLIALARDVSDLDGNPDTAEQILNRLSIAYTEHPEYGAWAKHGAE